MSGALRELISIFRIQFDDSGARKGDRALSELGEKAKEVGGRLRDARGRFVGAGQAASGASGPIAKLAGETLDLSTALKGLGIAVGIHQVASLFRGTIEAASDVDETLNVLNASFGEHTEAVKNAATTAAAEVGRSEFMLREFAGTIGAVVTPMLGKMGDKAAEESARISSDFAKLAVDLSSFFNTSEDEALNALRAGLTGETEPLKRFGIVATQENLAEFGGIDKGKLAKMKQAEKTMLRYRFIMAQTANAQGDAARTADGYANASRAVGSALQELRVLVGQRMLPGVQKLLVSTRGAILGFKSWARNSNIIEGALTGLGVALAVLAGKAIVAFAPMIATTLLWAAGIVALAIVVDELITTWEGGDSVIRRVVDGMMGVGTTAEAVEAIKGKWATLVDTFERLTDAWAEFWAGTDPGLNAMKKRLEEIVPLLKGGAGVLGALILIRKVSGVTAEQIGGSLLKGFGRAAQGAPSVMGQAWSAIMTGGKGAFGAVRRAGQGAFRAAAASGRFLADGGVDKAIKGAFFGSFDAIKGAGKGAFRAVKSAAAAARVGGSNSMNGLRSVSLKALADVARNAASSFKQTLISSFGAIKNAAVVAISGIGTAFRALTVAIAANPIGLALVAIAAAAALVIYYWDPISEWFKQLWADVTLGYSTIRDGLAEAFGWAAQAVKDAWVSVETYFTEMWDRIAGAADRIAERVAGAFKRAKGAVTGVYDDATGAVSGAASSVGGFFRNGMTALGFGDEVSAPNLSGKKSVTTNRTTSSKTVNVQAAPVNVTVNGSQMAPGEVERVVRRAIDDSNRGLVASVQGA